MIFDKWFGGKKRNEELMVSIIKGDANAVHNLLNRKANPNFVWKESPSWSTAKHFTPLFTALMAPKGANCEIVQALLDKGANPNTIVKNGSLYSSTEFYQSLLLIAVGNVANSSDNHLRQTNTDIYCALRAHQADMYCKPSKYEHKGDMSFANLEYVEWDLSIDGYLDQQNLRTVWADLEQTFESISQKKVIMDAVDIQEGLPRVRRM